MVAEGWSTEMDCLALYVLLEIADAALGNDDGYYTLDEVMAGATLMQDAAASTSAEEVFGVADLGGNGIIEYAELEAVLPYICDM